MEKALSFGTYLYRFILSPSFQEEQAWVKRLIKKLAVVSPNCWTASRFFGGAFTILLSHFGFYWLDSPVFLLFALTDWVDGKVARYLKIADSDWGAFLDALADKFFVIPVLWYWGGAICFRPLLTVMTVIEFGGNLLIFFLNKICKKKKAKGIFEHLMVGKYKFALQIVLAGLLRLAQLNPNWPEWPIVANTVLFVITIFAALSVGFKILRYFRDSPA